MSVACAKSNYMLNPTLAASLVASFAFVLLSLSSTLSLSGALSLPFACAIKCIIQFEKQTLSAPKSMQSSRSSSQAHSHTHWRTLTQI